MRLIMAFLSYFLLALAAHAQSSPGLVTGQVPSAAQWNGYFTSKADVVNGNLINPTISGARQAITPMSATAYTTALTDSLVCVSTAAPVTITLVSGPPQGLAQTITDCGGHATADHITVQATTGQVMGYDNVILTQDHMSLDFVYTGTTWVLQ